MVAVAKLVKKFPALYGTPKVYYNVHKSPSLDPILSQINPAHNLILLGPNLILPIHLCLVLLGCFFALGFWDYNFAKHETDLDTNGWMSILETVTSISFWSVGAAIIYNLHVD
jgi:hypothetical protein